MSTHLHVRLSCDSLLSLRCALPVQGDRLALWALMECVVKTLLDLSHVEMGLAQGPAAPIETVGVPEAESNRVYTREDLAQIADAEGITGLRRIGDKINVRGRSIGELIDAILKYQQAQ